MPAALRSTTAASAASSTGSGSGFGGRIKLAFSAMTTLQHNGAVENDASERCLHAHFTADVERLLRSRSIDRFGSSPAERNSLEQPFGSAIQTSVKFRLHC